MTNSNKAHDENRKEKQTEYNNFVENIRLVRNVNSTIQNGRHAIVNDSLQLKFRTFSHQNSESFTAFRYFSSI